MPQLKSKRIETVNKLAEKKEREAASEFGACMSQVQAMESQIRKLYQYREDYNHQFTQASNTGMDSARLQDYLKFINNINHSIDKIFEQLNKKKLECDSKKKLWLEEHQQVKIYAKVKEKYLADELVVQNKNEQKQSDEASLAFYSRNKR